MSSGNILGTEIYRKIEHWVNCSVIIGTCVLLSVMLQIWTLCQKGLNCTKSCHQIPFSIQFLKSTQFFSLDTLNFSREAFEYQNDAPSLGLYVLCSFVVWVMWFAVSWCRVRGVYYRGVGYVV